MAVSRSEDRNSHNFLKTRTSNAFSWRVGGSAVWKHWICRFKARQGKVVLKLRGMGYPESLS